MLSFISFWRAAAIVLNDLGSSAFYAGGIAERAIGQSAPWFILGVMLFSYAVRSVYVESCAMFTRGGVYKVVKEAMGGKLAKLSVSALMFDYILTGPISGVSAGQYVVSLVAELLTYFGMPWTPEKDTINWISAGVAALITLYFWRRNTRGVQESSDGALRMMKIMTVMAVLLIGWGAITLIQRPETRRLPPTPVPSHLAFSQDAVGWLPALAPGKFAVEDSAMTSEPRYSVPSENGPWSWLGIIGILIAFGHSFLAMSGEESLAQVSRELEYPKHRNLVRAGLVIFAFSLLFTSLVSFMAYAFIPDGLRAGYSDNLISGVALNLAGPLALRLAFQAFIVGVGFLILSGAVNTAVIGANGVLTRLSEDGVLTEWFRGPHRKFGTHYRMINLVAGLQFLAIAGSRGNVYVLGEAYAFGVIWSFALNGLAMFVLRFKDKSTREWKVPINPRLGRFELPLGLGAIALFMFTVAGVNLVTKQIATVTGLGFTVIFYLMFWVCERINERKRALGATDRAGLDQSKLVPKDGIGTSSSVRAGNVLCLVRDYNTLEHVRHAIELVDTAQRDIVVMTIRRLAGPDTGYENMNESELFTSYEQELFTRVVALAEKAGKHVELLVVPSSQIFQAIAIAASQMKSSEIIAGKSSVMTPEEQARQVGLAWEALSEKPGHSVNFRVIDAEGTSSVFSLGAHAPKLNPEDVELIHRLWLDLAQEPGFEDLHHHEVLAYALVRLHSDLSGPHRKSAIRQLGKTPPDR